MQAYKTILDGPYSTIAKCDSDCEDAQGYTEAKAELADYLLTIIGDYKQCLADLRASRKADARDW